MKALVVDGEWNPRKNYPLSKEEQTKKRANVGSQVWKNTRFEIKDVSVPNLRDDEILVRIKSCGICGSDTHLYETDGDGYIIFSGITELPRIIGHELAGIVEQTGKNVRNVKTGDWIAAESIIWCGMCQACRSGSPNQCKSIKLMGLSADGAFAEYVAINERYCWKINDFREIYSEEEAFDIGALIEPVGCAYNGMFIVGGGFHPGAIVVVYGAGPIGLGAIAMAKIAGASQIIAFDIIDERADIALEMGADFAFNTKKMGDCPPGEKVMQLTKGWGADIQIEAAGAAPLTIPEMENSMAINGKIIYLGRAATTTSMHLDNLVSGANKIIGARGHSGYAIFPSIIKLISNGKLELKKMITAKYPFAKIMDAIRASSERTDGKILINI
ncbi:MAG: alcohol dehydrogenase catalytic domain-containing protein [Candidatus Kuenenia sp.]|nr:alcohol dehydrogenase catalytic domain-containing protein [Candidatus Kuenenia hertensis]